MSHGYTPEAATEAVYRYLTGGGYAVMREVESPAGDYDTRRRIDLLGLGPHSTRIGPAVVAVEVKVTRQDYVADIANPAKQDPWRAAAGAHYFAAPAGMIPPESLPEGSGLLELTPVSTDHGVDYDQVDVTVPAPVNHAAPAPTWLVWQLAGRAAGAEAVLNRWATSGDAGTDLNVQVIHLEAALAKEQRRGVEYKAKAEAWKALAARQGHKVPCTDCGAPVVPVRFNAGAFTTWRHAQPHLTEQCPGNQHGILPREDV